MNKDVFIKVFKQPKLFYKLFFLMFSFFIFLIFLLWIFLYLNVILGRYYYKLGKFDKSEHFYEKAFKKYLNKKNKNERIENILNYNLANALYKNNKKDEASEYYKNILDKIKSKDSKLKEKILFNMGDIFVSKLDTNKANKNFKKALEIDPFDNEARFNFEITKLRDGSGGSNESENNREEEKKDEDNKKNGKHSLEGDKNKDNESKQENDNDIEGNNNSGNKEKQNLEKGNKISSRDEDNESKQEINNLDDKEKDQSSDDYKIDNYKKNNDERVDNAIRLIDMLAKENQKKKERNNDLIKRYNLEKDW